LQGFCRLSATVPGAAAGILYVNLIDRPDALYGSLSGSARKSGLSVEIRKGTIA
jgi:hypothetical protein